MPASDQKAGFDRYALIPRTLIFLSTQESLLLIRGAPHKRLWANRYNGVGGHVERGEDVLSAARRELVEETGYQPVCLWLCGIITIDTGQNPGIGLYVLRGEPEMPFSPPRPSAEGSLEWVPFSNVYFLPLVEDLPTLLPKVLATGRGDSPFFAHIWYDREQQMQIRFNDP